MLLGTGPRGGAHSSDPGVLEAAPRPVPTVDDFLYLFFGRSEAAKRAGRDFCNRRHQRADQDPPSSPEVIRAQIEANMHQLPKLDPQDPFAHLREIRQPTFILNGVVDVMIPTINSWHMVQNIPNAQLFVYPDAGHGAQFQYPIASSGTPSNSSIASDDHAELQSAAVGPHEAVAAGHQEQPALRPAFCHLKARRRR